MNRDESLDLPETSEDQTRRRIESQNFQKNHSAEFSMRINGYHVEEREGRFYIDGARVLPNYTLQMVIDAIWNSPERLP